MKINKKLSTAIVLSLMMGVYGNASAYHFLYGKDGASGTVVVKDFAGNNQSITSTEGAIDVKSTTFLETDSNSTAHVFTVDKGKWDRIFGGHR